MDALERQPGGVFLGSELADLLDVEPGDDVQVLFARATKNQKLTEMKVIGLFERLPGFPDGVDVLVNIQRQMQLIPSTNATFFLATVSDSSIAALDRAVDDLRSGPGTTDALQIDSRATALDKDQSSLTALKIRGLLTLDSAYALAMAATAITIFVFGLLLQRRREYVSLRAQGMRIGQIRSLLVTESVGAVVIGAGVGALVAIAMAYFLVTVLDRFLCSAPKSSSRGPTSRSSLRSSLPSQSSRHWRPPPLYVVYLLGSCCVMSSQSNDIPALRSGTSACGPSVREVFPAASAIRHWRLPVHSSLRPRQLAVPGPPHNQLQRRQPVGRRRQPSHPPRHRRPRPPLRSQQHGGAEGQRERPEIRPQELRQSHRWPEQLVSLVPGNQTLRDGSIIRGSRKLHHQLRVTVTDVTKVVNGVRTVVILDQDINAGQIGEASLDYLAQDKSGNIWYIGSYTEIYEGGQFVNAVDAWLAGKNGAKPGVWMMADPKEGMKYVEAHNSPGDHSRPRSLRSAESKCVPFRCFKSLVILEDG